MQNESKHSPRAGTLGLQSGVRSPAASLTLPQAPTLRQRPGVND